MEPRTCRGGSEGAGLSPLWLGGLGGHCGNLGPGNEHLVHLLQAFQLV